MSLSTDLRRKFVKRILAKRNRFQFGQPKDNLTDNGAVACTDTCLQLIIWMVKGKRVSLNRIRVISKGPTDGSRGLRPSEVMRVFRFFNLPYKARTDITAAQAMRIARNKGPVIIGELYWSHPQWDGYRYMGKTLKGSVVHGGTRTKVGFARLHGKTARSGLTQWTFQGGHAVLLAWATLKSSGDNSTVAGVRDPNHNSGGRPERPRWDELKMGQVNRMIRSIQPVFGGKRLVYVPTKVVIKKES